MKPLIGITCDLCDSENGPRVFTYRTYIRAVESAGGLPVALSPTGGNAVALLERLDAIVFSGGDDPRTEPFGVPTHPAAVPVHPDRQRFELALLQALLDRPLFPVLGICLGMQMMTLHAGGRLDQHMPETRPDWERHWKADHAIQPTAPWQALIPSGVVHSRHRQAVIDSGGLEVAARADDGVIEAVVDPSRAFTLGVQWHPERTDPPGLGRQLFERLVNEARKARSNP